MCLPCSIKGSNLLPELQAGHLSRQGMRRSTWNWKESLSTSDPECLYHTMPSLMSCWLKEVVGEAALPSGKSCHEPAGPSAGIGTRSTTSPGQSQDEQPEHNVSGDKTSTQPTSPNRHLSPEEGPPYAPALALTPKRSFYISNFQLIPHFCTRNRLSAGLEHHWLLCSQQRQEQDGGTSHGDQLSSRGCVVRSLRRFHRL